MTAGSSGGRRWLVRGAIALGVVVVLAVGIPFVYIHLIEGQAPAKLSLSSSKSSGAAGPVAGTWTVTSGSVVGYRVNETLIGQKNTAVGRTSGVNGTVVIKGDSVTAATFSAQMASVKSDESQRDGQFRNRIMDVSRYPSATFKLTHDIALGSIPTAGVIRSYPAEGELTLRGQTRPVSFTISAERVGSLIELQGDIAITFANWDIPNPSFGSFVTTADQGTLEFLLHLGQGATPVTTTTAPASSNTGGPGGGYGGRPPSGGYPGGGHPPSGGGGSPGGPGGGPGVTVSPTTTPPLTLGNQ